jgi:large-conductance mechanosensitive channel MscL
LSQPTEFVRFDRSGNDYLLSQMLRELGGARACRVSSTGIAFRRLPLRIRSRRNDASPVGPLCAGADILCYQSRADEREGKLVDFVETRRRLKSVSETLVRPGEFERKKWRGPMLEEFKKFAMRGNVVDLAVGVIIGAAFGTIVSSLVNDLVMPIIGAITGGLDFSNYCTPLSSKVQSGLSYADAKKARCGGGLGSIPDGRAKFSHHRVGAVSLYQRNQQTKERRAFCTCP